jgi:hypothetical protein
MFDTYFAQHLSDLRLEDDLRCLSDWQRRYLPGIHSSLGQQLLVWLIANINQPRPFSHLLAATTFSTTTVRHLLNQFAVLELVEIRKTQGTFRRGDIVATPRLSERLEEYAEYINVIISRHHSMQSKPPQSAGTAPKMLLIE